MSCKGIDLIIYNERIFNPHINLFIMKRALVLLALFISITSLAQRKGDPALTEVWQPEPRVVTPGPTAAGAPSDAIALFNGKDLSAWQKKMGSGAPEWKVADDILTVAGGKGDIQTKEGYGSCQLHIEWRTPDVVVGTGQGRGNSGIFLMGRYELQILDNYNNRTYSNGQAASIYKQHMPLVNACRPPGEWQTYDIVFTAPRFKTKDSSLISPAYITVIHNGVLVQNHTAIWGGTEYIGVAEYKLHSDREPIILQDHGNPVSFRNIWIRKLD